MDELKQKDGRRLKHSVSNAADLLSEASVDPKEGRLNPLGQSQQDFGGHSTAMTTPGDDSLRSPHTSFIENGIPFPADSRGFSISRADTNKGPINQQDTARGPAGAEIDLGHIKSASKDGAMPAAASIQVLTSSESENCLVGQRSSLRDTSPSRWFERVFYMVIHHSGQNSQRVTCLDTSADVDIISHQVVEDLGLQPEKYTGGMVRPLGGAYYPEGQITLSWHVAGFYKTYTTTFAVFNEQYSKDFDVLLGRVTIKKIGFYKKSTDIW
ncbi:MAG: hypothetical protein Q9213_005555 [Squamulea squamosa]